MIRSIDGGLLCSVWHRISWRWISFSVGAYLLTCCCAVKEEIIVTTTAIKTLPMGNYFLFCFNGEIPEVVVKYSFRSRFVDGRWVGS